MGPPNLGISPQRGEVITLKNREFSGSLGQHRDCGPCGVGFIQGTGGFSGYRGQEDLLSCNSCFQDGFGVCKLG
jgi:hypothetical protein